MKVFFLVLVDVFNFNLFEFSVAILEKGLVVHAFLTVRISSYGCTWEVWRALK